MNFLIIRKLKNRNSDNSDFRRIRMLGIFSMQSEFLVEKSILFEIKDAKKKTNISKLIRLLNISETR